MCYVVMDKKKNQTKLNKKTNYDVSYEDAHKDFD